MSGLAVPVGFRFHPTEEELVNHYLKKKIHGGNDAEIDNNIPALLGTETEGDDMEWFFFTRKEYKYGTSTRSNRSTKKGYWKITGQERWIKARRSKSVIGKKRTLTFYEGRVPNSKKTSWVMHEYYVPGNEVFSYRKQAQGYFVLCRLKNKLDKTELLIGDVGVSNRKN